MNELQKRKDAEAELLKNIEKEGDEILAKLKTTRNLNGDSLMGIMKTGETEFVKKTGRRMTYAEMRSAYG
jgi:hypothetical protein